MHAPHLPEDSRLLAFVAAAPTIWAIHFFMSYVVPAVWCARVAGPAASLRPVQFGLGLATIVALLAILWVGRHGHLRHRHGDSPVPHDEDSAEDRHRFLGFATLLLAGLSAVATLFVGISAIAFPACAQ